MKEKIKGPIHKPRILIKRNDPSYSYIDNILIIWGRKIWFMHLVSIVFI